MIGRISAVLIGAIPAAFIAAGVVASRSTAFADPTDRDPAPSRNAARSGTTVVSSGSDCATYLRVLDGETRDPAVLQDPRFKVFAAQSVNFVSCRAIAADSDEPCKLLDGDAMRSCQGRRSTFHEMRTNPTRPSVMLDDAAYGDCKTSFDSKMCDALWEALRSGDSGKCASTGAIAPNCQAIITRDKSQCRDIGDGKTLSKTDCIHAIDKYAELGKDLKELAESGDERERVFAAAALKGKAACDVYRSEAMQACSTEAPSPTAATAPPPGPKGGGASPPQ